MATGVAEILAVVRRLANRFQGSVQVVGARALEEILGWPDNHTFVVLDVIGEEPGLGKRRTIEFFSHNVREDKNALFGVVFLRVLDVSGGAGGTRILKPFKSVADFISRPDEVMCRNPLSHIFDTVKTDVLAISARIKLPSSPSIAFQTSS